MGAEWQRSNGKTLSKIQGYGVRYDLSLISNFTSFSTTPCTATRGNRSTTVSFSVGGLPGASGGWGWRFVEPTFGVQFRNDNVYGRPLPRRGNACGWGRTMRPPSCPRPVATRRPDRMDAVVPHDGRPSGRRIPLRRDGPPRIRERRRESAGIVSPKGAAVRALAFPVLPGRGTGFHSNGALGTTLKSDTTAPRRCRNAVGTGEWRGVGFRTVVVPRLQTTVSLWALGLGSELVYNGDLVDTEPGPASRRYGIEFANYFSPTPWLIFDGDVSMSQTRSWTSTRPASRSRGRRSGGLGGRQHRRRSPDVGSLRLRYFGPRALVETTRSARKPPTPQLRGRLPDPEAPRPTSRSTTCRRQGERHRLLLPLAASGRAAGGPGGQPHAPGRPPHPCASA